jgi:1-acyl-sn-glycerol-3-phosphate acyltransferase
MVLVNFPFASSLMASPLEASNWFLHLAGVNISIEGRERLPQDMPMILVSNHRSFMDALLLMHGVGRSVRFACHHYMSQVPGLCDIVQAFGCMPLDAAGKGQRAFFRQALSALAARETIGIFPEGATPMVQSTPPDGIHPFHRGFAHLAMRAPVQEVAIVPVAIASYREANSSVMPLRLLSWVDPSEPLFQQPGWHPAIIYREVAVRIGRPVRVDDRLRRYYQKKGGSSVITDLAQCCQDEVATLLK